MNLCANVFLICKARQLMAYLSIFEGYYLKLLVNLILYILPLTIFLSYMKAFKFEIEFRGSSLPRQALAEGSEYTQRSSRESTLWRRTPSMRRTAQTPVTQVL